MILRYILHVEWRKGYRPRILFKRAPRPGDRVLDGGEMGTLEACKECSGEGLLHRPDRLLDNSIEESPDTVFLDVTNSPHVYTVGEKMFTRRAEYKVSRVWDKGPRRRVELHKIPGTEFSDQRRRNRYLGEEEYVLAPGEKSLSVGDYFMKNGRGHKVTYAEPGLAYGRPI